MKSKNIIWLGFCTNYIFTHKYEHRCSIKGSYLDYQRILLCRYVAVTHVILSLHKNDRAMSQKYLIIVRGETMD